MARVSGSGRSLVWVAVAVVAALAALVIVVVRNADDEGAVTGDVSVAHVHGLGINPADGALYIATHTGTFRLVEGGEVERVGGSFQDTMGFTVAGPDMFLGSGHPDVAGMQAGQPGLLGLIESTDRGETWRSVSLSGEVDFHALAYAHDQVYGWDSTSGRFMVSADQRTWDIRSTLDLYSFAVDPADGDHVIAAGPAGIQTSQDGGRTWTAPGAPALVVVSWGTDGTTWGVDVNGGVQRSRDQARTWESVGRLPGEPQAFLVSADALWAAVHSDGGVTEIYRSNDGGQTWELRYRDPGS